MSRGGAPLMATDASDSGDSFSDANAGAPGDTGGTTDPTPVTCRTADIVVTATPRLCAGGSVTLTASTAISNVRYQWRRQRHRARPRSIVARSATPTFSDVTATTTYELTLVNDATDCYYDLAKDATVTVNPAPIRPRPRRATPQPTTVAPGNLSLTANATGTATLRYAWTGPNGFTSTQTNPTSPTQSRATTAPTRSSSRTPTTVR